jgi:hypothetical protein
MTHVHRFRPLWLLPMSPAWLDGYHRILLHARCIICGEEAYLAAWQSPTHLAGRVMEEGA